MFSLYWQETHDAFLSKGLIKRVSLPLICCTNEHFHTILTKSAFIEL